MRNVSRDAYDSFGDAIAVSLVPEYLMGFNDVVDRDPPDLRHGVTITVFICEPLATPPAEPSEVCAGRGVDGVAVELIGAAPPFDTPYYRAHTSSDHDASMARSALQSDHM